MPRLSYMFCKEASGVYHFSTATALKNEVPKYYSAKNYLDRIKSGVSLSYFKN